MCSTVFESTMEGMRRFLNINSKRCLLVILLVVLAYVLLLAYRVEGVKPWFGGTLPGDKEPVILYDYKLDAHHLPSDFRHTSLAQLTESLLAGKRRNATKLPFNAQAVGTARDSSWARFENHIRRFSLYDPGDPVVTRLLQDLASLPLTTIEENNSGSQMKLNVQLQDGGWAVLKPKKSRNDGGGDRYFAEIAAFHLDRLLGFYRVPPTVGRRFNMLTELMPLFPKGLQETVFQTQDGRACFYGRCTRACGEGREVCGDPGVDVSLMQMLPNRSDHGFTTRRNPWKHTKRGVVLPGWVSEKYLCKQTKTEFRAGFPYLLDVLDVWYFDMLIDNIDRHQHAFYSYFNNRMGPRQVEKGANLILFDNGKGFRDASSEDLVLNVFLYERGGCCLMKKTTFLKFLKLSQGSQRLSDMMRESLGADPLSPVLSRDHLLSMDRRLEKIMTYIKECFKEHGVDDVILDDMDPVYWP